jgi:hypothetical protein
MCGGAANTSSSRSWWFFLVFCLTAAPVMDVRRESPISIVVAALDDRLHRCQ